jgi:hypothetical protein
MQFLDAKATQNHFATENGSGCVPQAESLAAAIKTNTLHLDEYSRAMEVLGALVWNCCPCRPKAGPFGLVLRGALLVSGLASHVQSRSTAPPPRYGLFAVTH